MLRAMRLLIIWGVLCAAAFAQSLPSPAGTDAARKQGSSSVPVPHFEDIGQRAGLTVSHVSSPAAKYIIESVSGGVGLIDCDNDGKLDIIAVNGSSVDRDRQGGDPLITLYHQDANLKFTDI